jgi:uncharacterized protein YbaR (Trm112 family)
MELTAEHLARLACPVCHASLRLAETPTGIACTRCGRTYPIVDGLPVLIGARAALPR